VDTFDVRKLVQEGPYRRCLHEMKRRLPTLARAAQVPEEVLQARLATAEAGADFTAGTARLGGSYRAPWDTRRLPCADGQADVLLSNLVLPHIPPAALAEVIRETARVLKPGGYGLHRLNLHDEYATADPWRGALDFLRYSRRTWDAFFNHAIKYNNRLRYPHYLQLFAEAGFRPLSVSKKVASEAIPRAQRLGVAKEFRDLSWEDLATIACTVVLQKVSASPGTGPAVTPGAGRTAHEPAELGA
jgi:SAM-dependent methyltransferase